MRDVTQNSKSHSKWGVEDQAGRSRFPILHVYVAPPRLRKRPPSQLLRQSRKKSKGPCGLWFRYQPL